ncbi:MAG: helix-turn-helix transcriptional regulator [Deltaproteobacteria bacterium]|nr:helix-turn-helix transcriptional regulator [Deltaproteobacteria bacterium]
MQDDIKKITREILLGFWKVHILHHASEGPVVGQWMLRELQRHGYNISPGTLYPLLNRMKGHGWLRSEVDPGAGPRARKSYYLTDQGREVLLFLHERVEELWNEISNEPND